MEITWIGQRYLSSALGIEYKVRDDPHPTPTSAHILTFHSNLPRSEKETDMFPHGSTSVVSPSCDTHLVCIERRLSSYRERSQRSLPVERRSQRLLGFRRYWDRKWRNRGCGRLARRGRRLDGCLSLGTERIAGRSGFDHRARWRDR